MTITASVGKGGENKADDVTKIRGLLIRHRIWAGIDLRVTGTIEVNETFIKAIKNFQEQACAFLVQDGRVDPKGFTYNRLSMAMISGPTHAVFQDVCWNPGDDLTEGDYEASAKTLSCEKAAIKAVAKVESFQSPHDSLGRPTILFERHKFRKYSGGKFNATHSDISGPAGNYGGNQYKKLRRAAMLDEEAALKSASWGMFQIMGFNYESAGYTSVASFVKAMIGSQSNQLAAFVSFINDNTTLKKAIQDKSWATFARNYNGKNYAVNNYDTKMATAYKEFAAADAKAQEAKEPVGN